MRHPSRLCLAVWILALAASGGACAQPTPTPSPEPTPHPERLCPITLQCLIEVDAWIDWNGNGRRDPEDGPLKGVAFRIEYSDYGDGTDHVRTWTSDATGHYEMLTSCGCDNLVIRAEAPPGYRRTTQGGHDFGFAPP